MVGIEPRPFAGGNSGGTRAASPPLDYNRVLRRGELLEVGSVGLVYLGLIAAELGRGDELG